MIKNGFTLLEIIVVIAIIAMLAAILFPVMSQARENSRRAACASNMAQLAKSALQYSDDYDNRLVPLGTSLPQQVSWPQLLLPYGRHKGIFQCVSDNSTTPFSWANFPAPPGFNDPFHTSYLMNVDAEAQPGTGLHIASIEAPSESIYMSEGAITSNSSHPFITKNSLPKAGAWILDSPSNPLVSNPADSTYAGPFERHLETSNVVFVDGHVKALKAESWFFPNSNALKMDR